MTNAYARNAMKTGVQARCPGRPARTTWLARMPFMRAAVTSELDQRLRDGLREATRVQVSQPELEDERAPQRGAVVAASQQMLARQATHSRPVQEIVQPAVGRRELVDPVAQRPAEPRTERHRKPQLRVLQNLGRHQPADRAAEDVFPRP